MNAHYLLKVNGRDISTYSSLKAAQLAARNARWWRIEEVGHSAGVVVVRVDSNGDTQVMGWRISLDAAT